MNIKNNISVLLFISIPIVLLLVLLYLYSINTQINDPHNAEYNEIVNPSQYRPYISKGYSVSGDTNYFILYPPVNFNEDYIEFSLKFVDERTVNKVAFFYINAMKQVEDRHVISLYDIFYKPQKGINKFKVRNIFREEGTKIDVGFFWKDEIGKVEVPRLEKVTYAINK